MLTVTMTDIFRHKRLFPTGDAVRWRSWLRMRRWSFSRLLFGGSRLSCAVL